MTRPTEEDACFAAGISAAASLILDKLLTERSVKHLTSYEEMAKLKEAAGALRMLTATLTSYAPSGCEEKSDVDNTLFYAVICDSERSRTFFTGPALAKAKALFEDQHYTLNQLGTQPAFTTHGGLTELGTHDLLAAKSRL